MLLIFESIQSGKFHQYLLFLLTIYNPAFSSQSVCAFNINSTTLSGSFDAATWSIAGITVFFMSGYVQSSVYATEKSEKGKKSELQFEINQEIRDPKATLPHSATSVISGGTAKGESSFVYFL